MATLFPILIEVESPQVGDVLILLNKTAGIAKVHLDFDAIGKKPGKRIKGENLNGHGGGRIKNPNAVPTKSVIITELMTGPKNLDHLKQKLVEAGGAAASVSTSLYELQKKGVTESAGVGLHQLTERAMAEMKAQQAPQLLPPSKPSRGDSRPFTLQAIKDGLSRSEMRAKGEPLGITDRMIDGALTRMKKEKLIGATGEPGRFKIVPAKAARKPQAVTE